MNLPFWPFKQLSALRDELTAERHAYNKLAVEIALSRRSLAAAESRLYEQDAAFVVSGSIDRLVAGLASQSAAQQQSLTEALKGVAHAVGAVATATDKASNVQREWLEVSKSNR